MNNMNIKNDAKVFSNNLVVKKKLPVSKEDFPSTLLISICSKLDDDEVVSAKFLMYNGTNENATNFEMTEFTTKFDLVELLQSRFENEKNRLECMKEILFIIKRFDLLLKYLKLDHKDIDLKNSIYFQQFWICLFNVCDNIIDAKLESLASFLGLNEMYKYSEIIIFKWWNKFKNSVTKLERLKELHKVLKRMDEFALASRVSKFCELDYYTFGEKPYGIVLILNHKNFDSDELKVRTGTNMDRDNLKELFKSFNFIVKDYNDLKYEEVDKVLDEIAKTNHSAYSCFICCILSHGVTGAFYTRDSQYSINKLKQKFSTSNAKTLSQKPKLFFVQACRVKENENVVPDSIVSDGLLSNNHEFADFLFSYATIDGEYSYRDTSKGSWYCQTLVNIFKEDGKSCEIQEILTKLNNVVSAIYAKYDYVMKQLPEVQHTFRRKFKFC